MGMETSLREALAENRGRRRRRMVWVLLFSLGVGAFVLTAGFGLLAFILPIADAGGY